MANDVCGAVDIDGGEFVKFVRRDFPQRCRWIDDGCVVDEKIGRTRGTEGGLAKHRDIVIACDIAREKVAFGEIVLEMSEGDFVATAAHEGVPGFEELRDEGTSQTCGATSEPNRHGC